ncbi:MAG: hypothetical protein MI739_12580 [Bacteroidales bacterium]|nr:hypothetical protein [Bacteroidales bacterium]
MKKLIFIIVTFVLLGNNTITAQEKIVGISLGYPVNLTDHWLVGGWNNKINVNAKFSRNYNLLTVGVGLNYSACEVDYWFRYYQSDNKSISDLSSYILVGLNFNKNKFSIIPHTNIGYSFIFSNIEIYRGSGGLYVAPGFDINYAFFDNIRIGMNVNYNLIFAELDCNTDGWIVHCDFFRETDEIMKSVIFGVNIGYIF